MTFRFIDAHRAGWAVERMARVLEVSTSGYYAWKRRKPSRKALSDRILVKGIRDIQKRHKRRYGSPGYTLNSLPWGPRQAAIAPRAACG